MKNIWSDKHIILWLAFILALFSVGGSLYFSNIAGYVPCHLCWWQRIAIYPQLILFGIALRYGNYKVYRYSLPLLAIGWLISAYHNFLYYNVNFFNPNTTFLPCVTTGESCTTRYVEWFGFITIPLMSLLALTVMIILMLRLRKLVKS